ncbi:hypothetical protein [Trabulsiella guamensis]|uniref:hypothetical protein n=1 Tax=Trabulsiella guamensis TaxID=158852 RepID=UPI00056FCFAB|nr:hypothetical protein [Trabulsiella guamensis]
MSKRIIVRISSVLVMGIILITIWIFCKLFFAGSAYYTEQDWLKYRFYTPDLLKNMPRISDKIQFDFVNITGPDAHVFTVHFYGATDSSVIRNYLASEGYEPQKSCDVEAECWKSIKSDEVITIAKFASPKEIFVQIYQRFGSSDMEHPMGKKDL